MSLLGDIRTYLENSISPKSKKFVSVSQSEDWYDQGYSFASIDVYSAPADTNTYFLFDPTALDGTHDLVFEPLTFIGAEAGPIRVNIYSNPTVGAGSREAMLSVNRKSSSSNTNQMLLDRITDLGIITDNGTRFSGRLIPSASGGGPSASVGGGNSGGLPFEASPANTYLIEIDNENGSDAQLEFNVNWYEVPLN